MNLANSKREETNFGKQTGCTGANFGKLFCSRSQLFSLADDLCLCHERLGLEQISPKCVKKIPLKKSMYLYIYVYTVFVLYTVCILYLFYMYCNVYTSVHDIHQESIWNPFLHIYGDLFLLHFHFGNVWSHVVETVSKCVCAPLQLDLQSHDKCHKLHQPRDHPTNYDASSPEKLRF